MLANSGLGQLVTQSLICLLVGIVVYALSRLLQFQYRGWFFENARRAGLSALTAISVGWLAVSVLFFAIVSSESYSPSLPGERVYGPGDVMGQAMVALIAFGPALLMMRWRREPWASAGISRHNLVPAFVVGLLLALFSVVGEMLGSGQHCLRGVDWRLTVGHLWAFLLYAIVGFGEEFAFRGYLQTRMVAWLGRWQGWIITSILMALAHIVQRITMQDLHLTEAVISSVSLIPISLLMGYVMLRTENVVASGLFHTFANWVNTLC